MGGRYTAGVDSVASSLAEWLVCERWLWVGTVFRLPEGVFGNPKDTLHQRLPPCDACEGGWEGVQAPFDRG